LNLGLETLHHMIYSYTRPEVPFGAFLWHAISNRFRHAARRRQAIPLPRRHNQLLIAYNQTLTRLGTNCPFDEVVKHLGLSENDVLRLRQAQLRVHSVSQMSNPERDRLHDLPARPEPNDPQTLVAILDQVLHLLPIERLLLEEALRDPPRGWKSKAARKLGVTKGAVTQALHRGWHKLQRVLRANDPHFAEVT
jgi:DNA-directed RNA polymerase specialized sigma24 family protein